MLEERSMTVDKRGLERLAAEHEKVLKVSWNPKRFEGLKALFGASRISTITVAVVLEKQTKK